MEEPRKEPRELVATGAVNTETMVNLIKRVHHICCNPILPTVYSDALSYMEQLCGFSTKLNEVIDRLNEFTGTYESYVQAQLAPYQKQLDALQTKVDGALDGVDKLVRDLENQVSTAIRDNQSYVNSVVAENRIYVDQQVANNKTYVDGQIAAINDKIDAQLQTIKDDVERYVTTMISKQLKEIFAYIDEHNEDIKIWVQLTLDKFLADLPEGGLIVINPITGVLDTLQNALNALANACKFGALNCEEWDGLHLTVDQFDGKMLTAYQIDWESKTILLPNKWAYMYSPFTGEWVTIASVVDRLADYHKTVVPEDGALTAAEYDSADLTAQAYDDLNLTAYEYDWHGKQYIHPAA